MTTDKLHDEESLISSTPSHSVALTGLLFLLDGTLSEAEEDNFIPHFLRYIKGLHSHHQRRIVNGLMRLSSVFKGDNDERSSMLFEKLAEVANNAQLLRGGLKFPARSKEKVVGP